MVRSGARRAPGQPAVQAVQELGIPVMRGVPNCVRGEWGRALARVLTEISVAEDAGEDSTPAWERLFLAPTLLLAVPAQRSRGTAGRMLLVRRFTAWEENRFEDLWTEIKRCVRPVGGVHGAGGLGSGVSRAPDSDKQGRIARAEGLVAVGEFSRASSSLSGSPLAPRTHATLEALQRRRPAVLHEPIPPPLAPVDIPPFSLCSRLLLSSLRSAPRKSSSGPSGLSYDHLRVLMDAEGLLSSCDGL